jgi:hypothetical protein
MMDRDEVGLGDGVDEDEYIVGVWDDSVLGMEQSLAFEAQLALDRELSLSEM